MKLGKKITIIFDTVDEFNDCTNLLNINKYRFRPSLEQSKLGLSIFCNDESITFELYDWCYNCMKCAKYDCLYKTNEIIKYSEYKNMIRFKKICRIN